MLLSNVKETKTIMCVQKSATKTIPNEKDLIKANKDGFGDDIGTTTNRITTMFDVKAQFDKNSEEYKELEYRIKCGQHYQQCAIDKAKGIISKPMPKEWYDYKTNMVLPEDKEDVVKEKEFNLRILADKQPYFFTYIYPNKMNLYKKYISNTNKNCLTRFGITVDELMNKKNKTEDEELFLKYYNFKMPVGNHPCVMNKICWRVEQEFDGFLNKIKYEKFDYNILKSEGVEYSKRNYSKIKKLYKEYNAKISEFSQTTKKEKIDKEDRKISREIFKNNFKKRAFEICNNADELCNIVIDMCYTKESSKQFVWDIVGEVIVNNLLKKNNYKLKYPTKDENGDIKFAGFKFSMKEIDVREEYN